MTDYDSSSVTATTEEISCSKNPISVGSNNSNIPDIRKLIPPYLTDFRMLAKTAELRVAYDAPTDQTTYTFTLSWEDEIHERENYQKKSNQAMIQQKQQTSTSMSTTSSIRSSIPTNTLTGKTSDEPISIRTVEDTVHPVMAVCDGPCKLAIPSNKLNTLGRCGHYLCEACYGIVTNSDGTKGCSSFACNWNGDTKTEAMKAYEKEICQKQRKRAEEMKKRGLDVKVASTFDNSSLLSTKSSATMLSTFTTDDSPSTYTEFENPTIRKVQSTDSNDGFSTTDSTYTSTFDCSSSNNRTVPCSRKYPNKHEMAVTKLVLIEKTPYEATLRVYNQMESAGATFARDVIDQMLRNKNRDPKEYLRIGKLYYVDCENDGTKSLKRIMVEQLNSKRLFELPLIRANIFFVLDTIGYLKKEDIQISLDYEE